MFNLDLLTGYLIFLSVVLIVLPTIALVVLRRTLYKHLLYSTKKVKLILKEPSRKPSRKQKPAILNRLEERFEEASKNLEQVNTGALVDGIYSEETFSFFHFNLNCDKWEQFSRFLPNLLLSFGLFGTFLGIVTNLHSLTNNLDFDKFSGNNLENLDFEAIFEEPLQGMAIAFNTSLIAIICSSVLTLVNLRCNTSLAKYELISSLEDYLDNVLQPTIDGYTRLDKAVNLMVETQNQFLNRFHDNVERVLEKTMGGAADRIAAQNEKSHQLAEQVYEGIKLSSTTLLQGAEEFKATTGILQESATTFQAASVTIKQSKFADRLLEASNKLETIQRDFSQSVSNLQRATASVEGAISLFQRSTDEMVELGEQQVNSLERQSAQIKELSDNHQQNLNDISSKLEQGATNLQAFTTVVEQLNQNNQTSFSTIATKLEQGADNIAEFGLALQDFDNNNQQSLNNLTTKLEEGFNNIETFNKTVQQFNSSYENSLNLLTKNLEKLGANITQLQDGVNHMVQTGEKQASSLNQQIEQLSQLSTNHQQSLREIASQLRVGAQNIEEFQQVVKQLNLDGLHSFRTVSNKLEEGVEHMKNLGISLERFKNNNQKLLGDIATKLQ